MDLIPDPKLLLKDWTHDAPVRLDNKDALPVPSMRVQAITVPTNTHGMAETVLSLGGRAGRHGACSGAPVAPSNRVGGSSAICGDQGLPFTIRVTRVKNSFGGSLWVRGLPAWRMPYLRI